MRLRKSVYVNSSHHTSHIEEIKEKTISPMKLNSFLHLFLFGVLFLIITFLYLNHDFIRNKQDIVKSKSYYNLYDFHKAYTDACNMVVNVYFQFVEAKNNPKLQGDFSLMLLSMLSKTNCSVHLYITTDDSGIKIAEYLLAKFEKDYDWFVQPERTYYKIDLLSKLLVRISKPMKELFSSGPGTFYSKSLFHITPAIHLLLPKHIKELIILDLDMKFETDIKILVLLFNKMRTTHIIGLSLEQSPVYYHLTTEYRDKHPTTFIGKPPPHGISGFNGGVKLFNLEAMRMSETYNSYLDNAVKLTILAHKFSFKGHLGDQDFYSLLSFDNPGLFYILPCGWNRQLCKWWKEAGYADIFENYNNCTPPYHIIHGNCNTKIGMKEKIKEVIFV